MTIKSLSEIRPGDLVRIKSDAAGCDKAPCTKRVASVKDNTFKSDDKDDDDYTYSLNMDNYLGTVSFTAQGTLEQVTIHEFSK